MTDVVVQDRPVNRTKRTQIAIREVLEGRRRGLSAILPMAGPAVIVSIAYMDSRQFCDEYSGRREIRLWLALGRSGCKPDRDAVSEFVGETRHRDRP